MPDFSDGLVTRLTRLRAKVAGHKAAMRRHRELLQVAAAELATVEDECRRRGIGLVAPLNGAGDIHGRVDPSRS